MYKEIINLYKEIINLYKEIINNVKEIIAQYFILLYLYKKPNATQEETYLHQYTTKCRSTAFNPNNGRPKHQEQAWLLGHYGH